MAGPDIRLLAKKINEAITIPDDTDPIHECGPAPLQIIQQRPNEVLTLAHQKLHTWKYSEVPLCWRRLYEEASLWKAIKLMLHHAIRGQKRSHDDTLLTNNNNTDWIGELVHMLDMALILTGGPMRSKLIHTIFDSLQDFLDPDEHKDIPTSFPTTAIPTSQPDTFIRKPKLDFLQFQHHLDTKATPLIISGVMDDWPAFSSPTNSWSNPQYLLRQTLGGRRLVPVELGRSYTSPSWSQKIMTFFDYTTTYLLQPPQSPTGYLAQHDLLTQIPRLGSDTSIPDYCYCEPPSTKTSLEEPLRNAWLGPPSTISPLHTDPHQNILCQLQGSKYIRLYPPSATPFLYPQPPDPNGINMENTSSIDISVARKLFNRDEDTLTKEEIEQKKGFDQMWPGFRDAAYVEGILGPGQSLFIPEGWWHYVESLSTSFSMSFWW